MENLFQCDRSVAEVNAIPNLALALVGDGVYELMVRTQLCSQSAAKVQQLHKATVKLVNASAQAAFAEKLLPLLTEEEMAFFRRGKNAHTHAAPKAATAKEYALATGLETLFGALYLMGQIPRLNELFQIMMNEEP